MLLAVLVGVVIGCLTGFLVAKVGMPSFVVTLALFIAWQGVILQLIGDGGTLGLRDPVINAVANGNLSTLGSWILFVVAAGGYAAVMLNRQVSRRRLGPRRPADGPRPDQDRRRGRARRGGDLPADGEPFAGPAGDLGRALRGADRARAARRRYLRLDRTRFGRHVYAVGGNREAARRAGINVVRIRAAVFVISTAFAAIGAIIYSSKVGSVSPSAGGGNTLLFAVGGAVIGGTSLFGGRGRISNAVIGGAVLATVNNGLGLLGQPASVVFLVNGIVLLLAAGVDVLSRRRSAVATR